MPLLKRGPEVFPQGLFELPESCSAWFVAHTRSRQEKALARYLTPLEVPFYLPQTEKRVRHSGRNLVSHLPLFPGYVFLRGGSKERTATVRSNLIVRLLDVPDQSQLHNELRELRCLQLSGASFERAAHIEPGDAVRVTEGPFQGYTGVVVQERGRLCLIVSISMLRQSVAVEFERANLSLVQSRIARSTDVA